MFRFTNIIIILFFIITLVTTGFTKKKFSHGWATAKSGLIIRSEPSLKGKKIGLIPYKSEIKIFECKSKSETIAGKYGSWCRIKYKKMKGWVFSGFVVHHNPFYDKEKVYKSFLKTMINRDLVKEPNKAIAKKIQKFVFYDAEFSSGIPVKGHLKLLCRYDFLVLCDFEVNQCTGKYERIIFTLPMDLRKLFKRKIEKHLGKKTKKMKNGHDIISFDKEGFSVIIYTYSDLPEHFDIEIEMGENEPC